MRVTTILVGGLLAGLPTVGLLPTAAPAEAAVPVHSLTVDGTDVHSYPTFDPAVQRYAVTTTAATGGSLTVHATTSDPAGVVRVDGRVAPGGTATVTGLSGGDEVSVFIEDSGGTEVHSLVYLPAGFPALQVVTSSPGVAAGEIGLTLFELDPAFPRFATTVDRNGVPTHVEQVINSLDLKQQPDGTITLTDPTSSPGKTGSAVSVRDDQWRQVARYETVAPLVNTDNHDSILLPDGSRFLLAYEPNAGTGKIDAVIQEVAPDGSVPFEWSTAGLEAESALPSTEPDYAHVNSIQVVGPARDVVVSFRHFSSVYRIATRDHGIYHAGDVIWTLGGRHSDFTFVDDDQFGGPCAQHTASVLPNGHVLLFDDGSGGLFAPALCLDQAAAEGDPFTRFQSRAVEYALDETAMTATKVWEYVPTGRYSAFMGSTLRVGNGDTLIGWGGSTATLASEVDVDENLLWELKVATTAPYISYRASLMHVPDTFAPVVDQVSLADGATYAVGQRATVDFRCTDAGGSSLWTCGGDLRPAGRLDTSTPGAHTLHLTATDGAGNTTTVTRHYTVSASYQPRWTDDRTGAKLRGKRVSTKVTVVNAGTYSDRFTLFGTRGSKALSVRYKLGHRDVTRRLELGTFRTDVLRPGQHLRVWVVVSRTSTTRAGDHRTFTLIAQSSADPSRTVQTKLAVRVR